VSSPIEFREFWKCGPQVTAGLLNNQIEILHAGAMVEQLGGQGTAHASAMSVPVSSCCHEGIVFLAVDSAEGLFGRLHIFC
jgi:hypothetical protein